MPARHLALVGPTASGKSALALALAKEFGDFELVSVDSMQVYRGMDIGTAKPSAEEQRVVRHHLLDLVDADEEFTLTQFQSAARAAIADIEARGGSALLVGGTGLYLQAVVDNYAIPGQHPEVARDLENEPDTRILYDRLSRLDPVAAQRMEPDNRRRVVRALEVTLGSGQPFSSFGPGIGHYPASDIRLMGLWLPRDENNRRIALRVTAMIDSGWVDEVKALRRSGLSRTAAQALGYQELLAHLDGWSIDEAIERTITRTRSFARRQRMWFRRDPRIEWFAAPQDTDRLLPALKQAITQGGELP